MPQIKDYVSKASIANADLFLLQDSTDNTYKNCTRANLLAGLSSGGGGGTRGYFNQVMADYPDYYYRLGETSGSTATDSSGFNRNGTYSNVILNQSSLLVGDTNASANFNGSGFVSIPNIYANTNFDLLSGMTLECITSSTITPHGYLISIGQNNASNIFNGFTLLFNNGRAALDIHGITQLQTSLIASAGTHHIAMSFSKTFNSNSLSVRLFLNGVIVHTGAASCNIPNTLAYVGKADWGGNFGGIIDEAAIYGTELAPDRIYAHHKARLLAN